MEWKMKKLKINIPREVVEAIARKLSLNPSPTPKQVETIALWSILEGLGGSAFIDYKIDKLNGEQIIAELEMEIKEMIKDA